MCRRALAIILLLALATIASGCDGQSASVHGVVAGMVTDQVTGRPIEDVWAAARTAWAWTNVSGRYWLSLPQGTQSVVFRRVGYAQKDVSVTVPGGTAAQADVEMRPILPAGPVAVELTWSAWPKDLDAHLWTTGGFRVSYSYGGSLTSPPWARLDYDFFDGNGKETITITNFAPHAYYYSVYNYSARPSLAGCGAQVKVYSQSQLLYTFDVPHVGPIGCLVWDVFVVDGASREITKVNVLTNHVAAVPGQINSKPQPTDAGFRPVGETTEDEHPNNPD